MEAAVGNLKERRKRYDQDPGSAFRTREHEMGHCIRAGRAENAVEAYKRVRKIELRRRVAVGHGVVVDQGEPAL